MNLHIFPRWRFDTPVNQQIMYSCAQCNCARELWFNIQCSMFNSPVSVFLWQQLPLVHLKVSHFNDLRQLAEESISLVFSSLVNLNSSSLFSFVSSVSLTRWPNLLISVCVFDSEEVCTWNTFILQLDKEGFFPLFLFLFFCVFDKEKHPTLLQLENVGGVVLCFFFCVSVSVSVSLCDKVEHWNTSL